VAELSDFYAILGKRRLFVSDSRSHRRRVNEELLEVVEVGGDTFSAWSESSAGSFPVVETPTRGGTTASAIFVLSGTRLASSERRCGVLSDLLADIVDDLRADSERWRGKARERGRV